MRDEVVAIDGALDRFVEHHVLVQGRRGSVLHPAAEEVGDDDLVVLRIGIRTAEEALEDLDHPRRVPEGPRRVPPRADGYAIAQRGLSGAIVDDVELADDEAHEVGDVRNLLDPVELGPLAPFLA